MTQPNLNKAIIIGNVGQEPKFSEVRDTKVLKMSVATNKSWKDKGGKWQSKVTWHNIVAWGSPCNAAENLEKGDNVYIEGEIDNRSYESDGQKKYITEIRANRIIPISSREKVEEKPKEKEDDFPPDLPF